MIFAKRIYCRAYQLCFRIALPFMPYKNPKQADSLGEIPELLHKKSVHSILLVADAGVYRLGLTDSLESQLKEQEIAFATYLQETPNPTIADVETAVKLYRSTGGDAIVAVGGGSAIDCAKVVGARIAKPRQSIQKMKGILKVLRRTPLLIAVPTTAGTGSEATVAAVITDGEKHYKYPINDFCLTPDYAVLDAELTRGLPPFLTATTGLDALTHAVESYIGGTTNRFTRRMSVEAVRLIFNNLENACEDGNNLEARKAMLQAATCAGAAFTRSYVGYVHGIAHSLGGQYGIAHGLANAVILPVFLRIYGKSCEAKLATLAKESEIVERNLSDEEACEALIQWIEGLNQRFAIPKGFPEICETDIPLMACNADSECNPLYPVPRLMDRNELALVYYRLMTDKTE